MGASSNRRRGDLSANRSLASPCADDTGELKSWKDRARLAAEMGKALLAANDSLKAEKESYRTQVESLRRAAAESSRQLIEHAHETQDLRTRNAMLVVHLTDLEASNEALSRQVEALEQQRTAAVDASPAVSAKARELHDAESLLAQLADEEQRTAALTAQLSRVRVDNDRMQEALRRWEDEEVPALLREREALAVERRERAALELANADLVAANQELMSTVQTLELLHAGNEAEWRPIATSLVADPSFCDSHELERAVADMATLVAQRGTLSDSQAELEAFLREHLPQHVRHLVCASMWRAGESHVKPPPNARILTVQPECVRAHSQIEKLVKTAEELEEDLAEATRRGRSRSPRPAALASLSFTGSPAVAGSPLVVLEREREREDELVAQWSSERQQLLGVIHAREAELSTARGDSDAEVKRLRAALSEAKAAEARACEQLVEARSLQDDARERQRLEAELETQALLLEDSRRKTAELLVQNATMRESWARLERATETRPAASPVSTLASERTRRVSVGGWRDRPAAALDAHRAQTVADFSSTAVAAAAANATAAAERAYVDRVVELQRNLKVRNDGLGRVVLLISFFAERVLSKGALRAHVPHCH